MLAKLVLRTTESSLAVWRPVVGTLRIIVFDRMHTSSTSGVAYCRRTGALIKACSPHPCSIRVQHESKFGSALLTKPTPPACRLGHFEEAAMCVGDRGTPFSDLRLEQASSPKLMHRRRSWEPPRMLSRRWGGRYSPRGEHDRISSREIVRCQSAPARPGAAIHNHF